MTRGIDAVEGLLAAIFIVLASFSIAGIALAEIGWFYLPVVLIVGIALAIFTMTVSRRFLARRQMVPVRARDWLAGGVLIAIATILFLPPAEAIVDGGDASVYLGIGGMLASDHALHPADSFVTPMPPDLRADLFSRDVRPPPLLNYFPGGIQLSDAGIIEPNFFHLTSIWMALLDQMFGARGGLYVNGVFSIASVLTIWVVARRLAGPWAGLAAALLLITNFAEVWLSRWPTSEITAQYFLFSSVLFLMIASDERSRFIAACAGIAIGLAAFSRVDALTISAIPLLAWLGLVSMADRSSRATMPVALMTGGLTTAFAGLHAWLFTRAYTIRTFRMLWVGSRTIFPVFTLIGMVVVGAAIAVWLVVAYPRTSAMFRRRSRIVVLALGVALLAVLMTLAFRGASTILLTRVGVAVAITGVGALVVCEPIGRAVPLAIVFLVPAFVYLQTVLDPNLMATMMRRFVPALIPAAAVLSAYLLARVARWSYVVRVLSVIAVIAFVLIATSRLRPLLAATPYRGLYASVSAVARAIPENAVAIVDPKAPSHLAAALRYQFGRTALHASGPNQNDGIARVIQLARDQGRPIRVIVPSSTQDRQISAVDLRQFSARLSFETTLVSAQLERVSTRLPSKVFEAKSGLEVYEIAPGGILPSTLPLRIDLGDGDFPFAGTGFYPVERMQSVTARWTNGYARVRIPAIEMSDPRNIVIILRAAGPPASSGPTPEVHLQISGVNLGAFRAAVPGFADYTIALTAEQSKALCQGGLLEIESRFFVPARVDANSNDWRLLGIAIDWIEVQWHRP